MVEALPTLEAFVDLVRLADTDAPVRLAYLEQAAPILYGAVAASAAERETCADKFERWRYQILNNRRGRPSLDDQQLIDVLDLAGDAVLGRKPRPPKNPRAALEAVQWQPPSPQPLSPATGERGVEASPQPLSPAAGERGEGEGGSQAEKREAAHKSASCELRAAMLCLDPATPLEQVVSWATEKTISHAGRTLRLYVPLYLSSYCINHCLYCAFRYPHPLQRDHLSEQDALAQAEILGRRVQAFAAGSRRFPTADLDGLLHQYHSGPDHPRVQCGG